MMLRFSLNQPKPPPRIEAAVQKVLAQGLRTPDIYSEGTTKVGTREMGDAVVNAPSPARRAGETKSQILIF
jgi:3-isopropylmalate dehydrogenase